MYYMPAMTVHFYGWIICFASMINSTLPVLTISFSRPNPAIMYADPGICHGEGK